MSNKIKETKEEFFKLLSNKPAPVFIPTGLQDVVIQSIGENEHQHYHLQSFNDLGKTTLDVNIVKEIFWPSDNKYFQFPIYQKWPWPKSGCIVTIKESLKEPGAIFNEIEQWWPKGRYTAHKDGQHYNSLFKTDTGFKLKLYSNEQPPNQLESNVYGFWIMDEPAKPGMVSALNTRLKEGGISISNFTPVTLPGGFNPGPILDILEDLQKKGRRVKYIIFNDIYQNDKDTGLPNRFNERRGLRTHQAIEEYISGVSTADFDARIKGQCNVKSGRVYPDFNRLFHVIDLDWDCAYLKDANHFMAFDPHAKYFPFISWWALTQDEKIICYNEWPTLDRMNNKYYYEYRDQLVCSIPIIAPEGEESISSTMKLLDLSHIGYPAPERFIDPFYSEATFGKTDGLDFQFSQAGITFNRPPRQNIETQRNRIIDLMQYRRDLPPSPYNRSCFLILSHCHNMIKSFERHYYLDGKEKESEEYKDPVDTCRIVMAGIQGRRWQPNKPPKEINKGPGIITGNPAYNDLIQNPGLI